MFTTMLATLLPRNEVNAFPIADNKKWDERSKTEMLSSKLSAVQRPKAFTLNHK